MDHDDEEKSVVIEIEEFESIHLRGFCWGTSDQYFVWGAENSGIVRDQRNAHIFGNAITLLKDWHSVFTSVQKLSFLLSNNDDDRKGKQKQSALSSYLEYSKLYRISLGKFLEAETELIDPTDEKMLKDHTRLMEALKVFNISRKDYSGELMFLEKLKSLWHITEMLFIDPSRNITPSLIEWVRGKVDPPDKTRSEFWPLMARLTLLGHYGEVIKGLDAGGVLIKQEVKAAINQLLRQDPSLLMIHQKEEKKGEGEDSNGSSGMGFSEAEYRSRFQTWQEDVLSAQEFLHATAREGAGLVFGVLRGDPYVLKETAKSWEENFIGQVRFCRPYVSKDALWRLAEGCGEPSQPDLGLDLLCCPAEEQEKVLQKTLIQIIYMGPKWCTVHLLDLLTHAIPHSRRRKRQDVWRERELLEYGTSIMQHPSLGELAQDYFLACPSKGISALRALIEVQPLKTDDDATRMLVLCDKFGFPELQKSICNQMANTYLKKAQGTSKKMRSEEDSNNKSISAQFYGTAVKWMCKSYDVQRLSALSVFLCGMFMDGVSNRASATEGKCGVCEGEFERGTATAFSQGGYFHPLCLQKYALEAIASVVQEVGQNPEYFNLHYYLPFLLHFQQLCEHMKRLEVLQTSNGEHDMQYRSLVDQRKARAEKEAELEQLVKASLSIVVRALSMKVAPRRLWIYLLHSSVRLLETTPEGSCLLNQIDTFKLMSCLDELTLSHWNLISKDDANIKMIRLGLTRNLARAIKNGC